MDVGEDEPFHEPPENFSEVLDEIGYSPGARDILISQGMSSFDWLAKSSVKDLDALLLSCDCAVRNQAPCTQGQPPAPVFAFGMAEKLKCLRDYVIYKTQREDLIWPEEIRVAELERFRD